jgi:hypothetical protein
VAKLGNEALFRRNRWWSRKSIRTGLTTLLYATIAALAILIAFGLWSAWSASETFAQDFTQEGRANDIDVRGRLDDWGQLGSAIAGLAAVAGLTFVGIQLRAGVQVLLTSHFDATASTIRGLNQLFIDRPDMKPFIYGGMDIDDEQSTEAALVETFAEMHTDFIDTELLRARTFGHVLSGLPSFEPWIGDLFTQSPALCRFLVRRRSWYSDQLFARYVHLHERTSFPRPVWPQSSEDLAEVESAVEAWLEENGVAPSDSTQKAKLLRKYVSRDWDEFVQRCVMDSDRSTVSD